MIYLAGPYRGANAEEVQRNLSRIGLLSRLLVKLGAGPVSVHAAVHAGHYGDDADPAARRDGIAAAVRIATGIGAIIALEQDGGGLSAGTAEEVMAVNNGRPWSRQHTPQRGIAVVRWDDIGPAFQVHGLGGAWSALRPQKPVVRRSTGRWIMTEMSRRAATAILAGLDDTATHDDVVAAVRRLKASHDDLETRIQVATRDTAAFATAAFGGIGLQLEVSVNRREIDRLVTELEAARAEIAQLREQLAVSGQRIDRLTNVLIAIDGGDTPSDDAVHLRRLAWRALRGEDASGG